MIKSILAERAHGKYISGPDRTEIKCKLFQGAGTSNVQIRNVSL